MIAWTFVAVLFVVVLFDATRRAYHLGVADGRLLGMQEAQEEPDEDDAT